MRPGKDHDLTTIDGIVATVHELEDARGMARAFASRAFIEADRAADLAYTYAREAAHQADRLARLGAVYLAVSDCSRSGI